MRIVVASIAEHNDAICCVVVRGESDHVLVWHATREVRVQIKKHLPVDTIKQRIQVMDYEDVFNASKLYDVLQK